MTVKVIIQCTHVFPGSMDSVIQSVSTFSNMLPRLVLRKTACNILSVGFAPVSFSACFKLILFSFHHICSPYFGEKSLHVRKCPKFLNFHLLLARVRPGLTLACNTALQEKHLKKTLSQNLDLH